MPEPYETQDFPDWPDLDAAQGFPDWPGGAFESAPTVEVPRGSAADPTRKLTAGFPDWPKGTTAARGGAEFPDASFPQLQGDADWPESAPGMGVLANVPEWPQSAPADAGTSELVTPAAGAVARPDANWPDAAGALAGGGIDLPAAAERAEAPPLDDVGGLLRQILSAVGGSSGGGGSRGGDFQYFDPAGPLDWAVKGGSPPSPEDSEDYAAASPSIDATSLNGARGAGGWGYGSRGQGQSTVDFLEPSRRMPGGQNRQREE